MIMSIISRIKQIISANINSLVEKAEDPESMLKQLIREMDENIINLRNESVKALATEKRFSRQIEATKKKIRTWQENSEKAILDGNDKLARDALARKIQETRRLPELEGQRSHARETGTALKEQLRLLEDKVQEARRRKEILVARKRSAQSLQATATAARDFAEAARKSDVLLEGIDLEDAGTDASLEDQVVRLETEAEAMKEIMEQEPTLEETFEKIKKEEEIERQLEVLKEKLKTDA